MPDAAKIAQQPKKPRGLFENISQSSEDNEVVPKVDTPKFAEQKKTPRDFSFRVGQPDVEQKECEQPGLFLVQEG